MAARAGALDPPALMRRALALAERGGGATSPNPMVGCVLASDDGRVLGEGYHGRAGGPHAEILALRAAREAGHEVSGATAVVTLEPCAHHGRTPPCTEALIEAEVARVVYAHEDPAEGKGGAALLRAADLEVVAGVERDAARRLNEAWLHFARTGRPFVHVKVAQTLSGHVTRGTGGARWITGPEARAAVHRLRHRHPAVLVGSGTVLADDPVLTVRDWPPSETDDDPPWPDVRPLRVVLDARLRVPLQARLVASASDTPVVLYTAADAPRDRVRALTARGVEVVSAPPGEEGGVDPAAVLDDLADRGIRGVLVEPGPTLARGLLDARVVDRWTAFVAPDWIGASDALPLVVSDDPFELALVDAEWSRHGRDVAVTGRLARDRDAA